MVTKDQLLLLLFTAHKLGLTYYDLYELVDCSEDFNELSGSVTRILMDVIDAGGCREDS